MRKVLLLLILSFTLFNCKKPTTAPEEPTYPLSVKLGNYEGTFKKSNKETWEISIVIEKSVITSEVEVTIMGDKLEGAQIFGTLDPNDESAIVTITSISEETGKEFGYIIDFENMTATSIGGLDNKTTYNLVKIT